MTHHLAPADDTDEQVQWHALCDAARSGDRTALGQLFQRLRPQLLRLASRDLGSDLNAKVGASDVVQKSLMEALDAFDRFSGGDEADFRAWVHRILNNNLIDTARQFRTSQKRCTDREVPIEAFGGDVKSTRLVKSVSSIVRRKETDDELFRAVARLPDRYRKVVELRFRNSLSHAEIATEIGISEVAARKVLSRAIEQLRSLLAEPADVVRPTQSQ